MNSLTGLRVALLLTVWLTTWSTAVAAQTYSVLASPFSLGDVIRLASERRDEMQAARARIRAGEARPSIVSALQDAMIPPSLDHLPFMLGARMSASRLTNRFRYPAFAGTGAHPPWRMSIGYALTRAGPCWRRHPGRQRLPHGAGT
jgi:hypothetical protein